MTRNTCFVLLMGLEEDLTQGLRTSLSPSAEPLTEEERSKALDRYTKDKGPQSSPVSWPELVPYLDLSEKLAVLSRYRPAISSGIGIGEEVLSAVLAKAVPLVPVRNRVCHARPLEEADFPTLLDMVQELLKEERFPFDQLAREYRLLRANQYPFAIAIPDYWQSASQVVHNLPPPDFDDTGFIGRDEDRKKLFAHLLGSHPVITVTGEGGLGKTALTLRCLYDLIDRDQPKYEVVLFGSLKANRLTAAGVVEIVNAAADETEVLAPLMRIMDNLPEDVDREGVFAAALNLMSEFRVLLVIDNIETIELEALRPLLEQIPPQSKVLLTSRRALGEIEIRNRLDPMSPTDAARLFRRLARIFNVDELGQRDNKDVEEICRALYFSPLLLRWFVEGYSGGKSVAELLRNPRQFDTVLEFCFDNVYHKFTPIQRELLKTLVVVPGPLSEVQLALLTGVDKVDEVRTELQYLYASNVVRRTIESGGRVDGTLWTTTDFARRYVNAKDNRPINERQQILKHYRALLHERDSARLRANHEQFRHTVIAARTADEAAVVRMLRNAQTESAAGNHRQALKWVNDAMALQPEFYEVWRVSAQVKDMAGDIGGAYEDFDQALARADGRSEPLLVFYSLFLRRNVDFDGAVAALTSSATKPTAAPQLVAEFAWLHVLMGEPAKGAELFASIEDSADSLGDGERAHYVTQYASSLRRAAEAERRRSRPNTLAYIRQSLDLLARQVGGVIIDPSLVKEGQRCFDVAARTVAETCDTCAWQLLEASLRKISAAFPLIGEGQPGVTDLEQRCPQILTNDVYKQLAGASAEEARLNRQTRWRGNLREVFHGREYGFIQGSDGRDYFLHQTDFLGPGTWEDLWGQPGHHVEFTPGPQISAEKAPKAYYARLLGALD